ncbi:MULTISPECIES: hypothetical protein [unclassified Frondihabitans]|uniref:hypothetical protein n=1 Tax=unclassified Frondihabitans TaxID=2626248 RepID=UPI000F4E852E|nr:MULTISPECIES: hypothetical protein [unclassified Frondihabitans]
MYIKESQSLLLVVEGPDDYDALKDHCSSDLHLMAGTGGRAQVLSTAELANSRGLKGVRFLVDRDYDGFTGDSGVDDLENVFASEHHDLFMDLIVAEPDALYRVIYAHTRSARRRPISQGTRSIPNAEIIGDDARALATKLAAVRIVNSRNSLGLDFSRFSFGGLKVRDFDVEAMARIVCVRSAAPLETHDGVVKEARAAEKEIRGLGSAVGDHDLFSAIGRVLKRYEVNVSPETLLSSFLVAFSCAAVAALSWFSDLQNWCEQNLRAGMTCAAIPIGS